MKFRCEHRFANISLSEFERLYFSEEFNVALCKAVNLQRTLVSRDEANGRLKRVVKVAPDREIPAPAARILGSNKIEYTETIEYSLGSGRVNWSTVSSVMTDKVDSRGTVSFSSIGGQVVRTVEGDVTVRIPLVGGTVEKFIIADIEKSYERAAEFTRTWIASHPA